MPKVELHKSERNDKKYKIVLIYDNGKTKTIHIGSKGMEDYTTHKDPERKERYISRHKAREDWTKSGMETAGFWAKHLLWNEPSLSASIKDIEKRFNVNIIKRL